MLNKIYTTIKNYFKSKTKREIIVLSLVFASAFISLFSTITYSRYVFSSIKESYLISKEFYFYSDTLGDTTSNISYELNDWDGDSNYSFDIDLKNYKDDLRWTQESINYNYTISCNPNISGNVTCTSSNNGTLTYSSTNKTQNRIPITLTNANDLNFEDNDYVDIEVTVTSSSPFTKTLSATYRIGVSTKTVVQKIIDAQNQKYLDLVLSNNSLEDKTITLTWTYSVLSIDNTNDIFNDSNTIVRTQVVNNVSYINQVVIVIPSRTVYSIRYYKTDATQNYTYPITNSTPIITMS